MHDYKYTIDLDDLVLRDIAGELFDKSSTCGEGDFIVLGKHFVSILKDNFGINRKTRILDVGCSIGRLAIPLTQLVDEYDGFDVVSESIALAQKNISSRYPNFRFQHFNIYNFRYNKDESALKPEQFEFPYPDKTFDIVVLVSVFTHTLKPDTEGYLKQIARVMKVGWKAMITFLLDEERTKNEKRWFDCNETSDPQAHPTDWVKAQFKANHLRIDRIDYGWWGGNDAGYSAQDIIYTTKVK